MLRSEPTPITLSPSERDLILTLRSNKAAEVTTVPAAYLELLHCVQRDVAEATSNLSRANNIMAHLVGCTIEEGVLT